MRKRWYRMFCWKASKVKAFSCLLIPTISPHLLHRAVGNHPRALLVGTGNVLWRIDIRAPGTTHPLTQMMMFDIEETIHAIARPSHTAQQQPHTATSTTAGAAAGGTGTVPGADSSGIVAVANHLMCLITSSRVLLLDLRRGQAPLMAWSHEFSYQPPSLLQLVLLPLEWSTGRGGPQAVAGAVPPGAGGGGGGTPGTAAAAAGTSNWRRSDTRGASSDLLSQHLSQLQSQQVDGWDHSPYQGSQGIQGLGAQPRQEDSQEGSQQHMGVRMETQVGPAWAGLSYMYLVMYIS